MNISVSNLDWQMRVVPSKSHLALAFLSLSLLARSAAAQAKGKNVAFRMLTVREKF